MDDVDPSRTEVTSFAASNSGGPVLKSRPGDNECSVAFFGDSSFKEREAGDRGGPV
jgi:hypothetical protein